MDHRERLYDEWLVAQCQVGSTTALDMLVRRWHLRLLRHALLLTGDREAASDVAQDAWVAIVRGLSALNDPVAFPAWAFRILRRKSIEWIRRRQRRRRRDRRLQSEADHAPRAARADPRAESLTDALTSLEPDRRALVLLHYFENLSVAELAEVFGVPIGTVKTRLYHSRRELRRIMEESQ